MSPIEELIRQGESHRLELMPELSDAEKLGRTICAFLNSSGGTVVVGVDDGGKIIGLMDAEASVSGARAALIERIHPVAGWSSRIETAGARQVAVIDVPAGPRQPYVFDQSIFVRTGSTTRAATGDEITAIIDRRSVLPTRWERLPTLGAGIEELDEAEVHRVASEARKRRLYPLLSNDSMMAILEKLNLANDGAILNGAMILFGKNPQKYFPQTRVRVARFAGVSQRQLAETKVLEGHIFSLLSQAWAFFSQHLGIRSELPESGLQRMDRPALPEAALREAVINAMIHRDYARFDGGMSIAIFTDRVEIWNSGELPAGLSFEALAHPHPSLPHNPDIANVFYLQGMIEGWGIGTTRILSLCEEAGLAAPEWSTPGSGILLTLRLATATERPATAVLNPRQLDLLHSLRSGEQIEPTAYYRRVVSEVKERRARQDLSELADLGYLRRQGKTTAAIYVRTEKEPT